MKIRLQTKIKIWKGGVKNFATGHNKVTMSRKGEKQIMLVINGRPKCIKGRKKVKITKTWV